MILLEDGRRLIVYVDLLQTIIPYQDLHPGLQVLAVAARAA